MVILVMGSQTPTNVGLRLVGKEIETYAGCCGSELKRTGTKGSPGPITCTCGFINVEPNNFTTSLKLDVATPGVWPKWVEAFCGFPAGTVDIKVENLRE